MIELLAPAGSMEALRAAVQNGANAVYLGCGNFNARQSAKNFTPQTLGEALKYCHIRGVAVHLTLNTLVSDREIPELTELIRAEQLPAVFVEQNGSRSAASILSRETGCAVGVLDMIMSGTDYFEAMEANIQAVKEALS